MTQDKAKPTPAFGYPSEGGSSPYPLLGGVPRRRWGGFRVDATPQTRTVPLGKRFPE